MGIATPIFLPAPEASALLSVAELAAGAAAEGAAEEDAAGAAEEPQAARDNIIAADTNTANNLFISFSPS